MKNARLLCLLSFGFGSALTLFICTFGPPAPVHVNAREHAEAPSQSIAPFGRPHHSGTLEAVPISLANPNGTSPDLAVPAYLLRVRLDPECNLDEIIHYWGRGGREKLIAPLVTSIARVPGGGSLNISYLLPTFARLRVYTYPASWPSEAVAEEDCVFSALNFFNDTLNTNLFDRAEQARILKTHYEVVRDEPVLGDLVTLLNSENELFHACVYIADGFVFTKNGSAPAQPWILMKLSDMLAMYEAIEKPKTIAYLRRKEMDMGTR
jgi:hypothetical protein